VCARMGQARNDRGRFDAKEFLLKRGKTTVQIVTKLFQFEQRVKTKQTIPTLWLASKARVEMRSEANACGFQGLSKVG